VWQSNCCAVSQCSRVSWKYNLPRPPIFVLRDMKISTGSCVRHSENGSCWCIQYLLDCKSVLQGTDCPYFTYEFIANPVQKCRFVLKNATIIVFVVYECLKSIRPFKEQIIIIIKKSRYQVPRNRLYTPYLF